MGFSADRIHNTAVPVIVRNSSATRVAATKPKGGSPVAEFTTLLFGTGIQTTVAPGFELRDSPEGTTWVKKSTV